MKKLLVALTLLFIPALGWATACPTYTNTYQLQVAAVTSTSSNQSNFPVLFKGGAALAVTGSSGYSQSSGVDVVFCTAATGGTVLPYELVAGTYVSTTGAGEWWVQFPTVSYNTAETIYVMVGAASATNYSSPSTLWSAYSGVWHFGTSATLTLTDSTGNNAATNHGATAVAGEINGGAAFVTASSEYIDTGGNQNPPTPSNGLSVEAYASSTNVTAVNMIASNDSSNSGFDFYQYSQGISMQIAGSGATSSTARCTACGFTTGNVLYHVVGTWNGSNAASSANWKLYVNGTSKSVTMAATAVSSYTNASVDMAIGRQQVPANYDGGVLDEVRVSNQTLTADWVEAEYLNESAPTSFYTFSSYSTNCPTPTFLPGAGIYSSTQTPSMTSAGCTICYSLTTTPVVTGSSCTTGTSASSGSTVSISATSTLSALAYQSGDTTSSLASGLYTIGGVSATSGISLIQPF